MKREVIENLGEEETDRFEKWAFGENFTSDTKLSEIPNLWNAQHPELEMFYHDDQGLCLNLMMAYYKLVRSREHA